MFEFKFSVLVWIFVTVSLNLYTTYLACLFDPESFAYIYSLQSKNVVYFWLFMYLVWYVKTFGFWQTSSASKYCSTYKKSSLPVFMDLPFKTSKFLRFLNPTPSRRHFFITIHRQIWRIFDPSPQLNGNVLNGWSLIWNRGSFRIKLFGICISDPSKVPYSTNKK